MGSVERHQATRGEFRLSRQFLCGDERWTPKFPPYNRAVMSPVGSPPVCGCRRELSTSYYGGRWPDLAPGVGNSWPIPVGMRIYPVEACGPPTWASVSEPLFPAQKAWSGS